ncbi:C-type mannose receptor 2 [Nothobranchius furzeri]|uniref:C-type mannose receptor 2 n=1 Tax=Nothobranchius furzeri TaxID=105023 RepID=UPI003904DE03
MSFRKAPPIFLSCVYSGWVQCLCPEEVVLQRLKPGQEVFKCVLRPTETKCWRQIIPCGRAKMQWSLILLFLMAQSCVITCQLHEYLYVGENKSWSEAQRYCRDRHTDLATVSNMADMKRLISESSGNRNEAWIGLRDQTGANRTWYWSLPGVEFNDNLKWNDFHCEAQSHKFLCYDETNTRQFFLINQPVRWLEAQRYCRESHTDLISGWNQLQDPQLKDLLSPEAAGTNIHIGMFRDTWKWSDGSRSSFRLWKTDNVILIKEKMNWEEALYYCRDHYHDLVTITNLDDQRWVEKKVKDASTPFVWTGLRYTCTLDFWFWVSDEVVSYKNWVSGGPEDDCDMSGAMETGGQHQWVKKNDNEEFNFICSKA